MVTIIKDSEIFNTSAHFRQKLKNLKCKNQAL